MRKSMLYTLDMANLSYMPSWGMGMLLKTVVAKQFGKMQAAFKSSDFCRRTFG